MKRDMSVYIKVSRFCLLCPLLLTGIFVIIRWLDGDPVDDEYFNDEILIERTAK